MVFSTPNDTETNWQKGTHGNRSRVLLYKVKLWLSKKNISFLNIYRKSKPNYIHQSYVLTVIEETYKNIFDATLWPPGVNERDYNPQKIYIMAELSVISSNCKGFNVLKEPCIKILLDRCSVFYYKKLGYSMISLHNS